MSRYEDDLSDRLRMDLTTWPHQFVRDGRDVELGKSDLGILLFATPMICIHCNARYINRKTPRPADPCPARGKEQVKRILNG